MHDYLSTLVQFKTRPNDIVENRKAFDYLEREFSQHGLHISRSSQNGHESIVATVKDTKTPTVFFAAHMDVVAAPDKLFTLREDQENYYGRGVYDMKLAIASYLVMLDQLRDELKHYDIGFMITSDEEVGGTDGVGRLAEEGYLPKIVVLPDGGENWMLESRSKGVWIASVETSGVRAHGSRPWEGENAVNKLLAVLADIRAIVPDESPEATTLTLSQLSGGPAFNQVPSHASASMDFRFYSAAEQQKITEAVQEICTKHGAKLTTLADGPTVEVDVANPYVQAFMELVEQATGKPQEQVLSLGASDARFFAAKGITCIVTEPVGGGRHADTEWVNKASLDQFTKVLIDFAKIAGHLDSRATIA